MTDCVFCKILKGDIKTDFLYRDEYVACFKDLKPATPIHFLVIPVKHISNPAEVKDNDLSIIGKMFQATAKLAKDLGIEKAGYRMVINIGPDAGQEIPHMHLHILGGRRFSWPPG